MKKKVLIVDDDEINAAILQKLLADEYELEVAYSGEDCLQKMQDFAPGLVLLDIMMAGIDGYETCRRIKSSAGSDTTQVVLVSAKASTQERLKGYAVGADDYVVKPFDHDEMLAKVRIQFRLRGALASLAQANAALQNHSNQLERLVKERTAQIVATRDVTVFALAKLAESRDPETGEHLERIRAYCHILAAQLARQGPYADQINDKFLDDLYRSSPLHDVGKVGIPDVILLKPDRLNTSEFEIMKRHTLIGARALETTAAHQDSGGFLNMAVDIARCHHERFDGSGYPDGIKGVEISLPARITALADVYDALTSLRVYKFAFDPQIARMMIEQDTATHFDPVIVQAFIERYDDFLEVQRTTNRQAPISASVLPWHNPAAQGAA